MDVYTCSSLNNKQISVLLNELGRFQPTHANVTLLNRKWSLIIEKQDRWELSKNSTSWAQWVEDRF